MNIQVTVRPQKEGDAIYTATNPSDVTSLGTKDVIFRDKSNQLIVAAPSSTPPIFDIIDSFGPNGIRVKVESEYNRVVIAGIDRRPGDYFPLKGIVFELA